MTTYDANYPKWMEEYEIREEENFPEIQKYLVKKENVFNEIIKKDENFNDILKTVSLKMCIYNLRILGLFTLQKM